MDIQKMFAERIGGKDFGTKNDIYKFACYYSVPRTKQLVILTR